VRRLPTFVTFLEAAALADAELVSFSTIARDCGVSGPTVKEYFQILCDTLLGRFLPAYVKRPKRRVIQAPKFYFADVGVVNTLARRGRLEPGSELFGKAFENWVGHELHAHRQYSELFYEVSYWRLASGIEVDFVLNDMEVAIEAKATARITSDHLKGLRQLVLDHSHLRRRLVICLEPKPRRTEDGIEVLPYADFTQELWDNSLGLV
jgi:predicted AAA+ superfamily ATPase